MIPRAITDTLRHFAKKYPVVTLTGPRQSGKSTLLRHAFSDYAYVSLEDPDVLMQMKEDTRLFLRQYPDKTIIDEAQRHPALFSYLQTHVDEAGKEGMYLLSGSHNFLLMESISQTLAGRTAVLQLLPFSLGEIRNHAPAFPGFEQYLFTGSYPRIYDKKLLPGEFYPFYIQTYIERDVRQMKNISDLNLFIRFVKLCAGRIGQLLNLASLANECGITHPTARAWLSVLEASYIVYLLQPYHHSFNKRLIKSPKLYFTDTGLACSLLEIGEPRQLFNHFMRGALFENMIVAEKLKDFYNRANPPAMWFWRDHTGNEVDLLLKDGSELLAFEIKAGSTYNPDFFKGLRFWKTLSGASPDTMAVIYGGRQTLETKHGSLFSWDSWLNDTNN